MTKSKANESSKQAPDDALVESLREAYRPEPLQPLQRARIRARVRARLGDEAGERALARRSGWGLVPAAAAMAGVMIAMVAVLSSQRPEVTELPPVSTEDLSAAALLLGDDALSPEGLVGDGLDAAAALPPDYQALSALLGGPA